MLDKINNICKIEYTAVDQVTDFTYLPGKLIHIEADWTELDFVPNAQLGIDKRRSKAGEIFESEFASGIRTEFLKTGSFIFRFSFSDGADPMIIGSVDLPVRLEESHNLTSKRITFSYRSWHYPYRVPVSPTPDPDPDPVPATITWELAEWDTGTDFIDANMRIFVNEVMELEQFGNGTGSLSVEEGDNIRVQYSYLDIAEGAPVSPHIQVLIDGEVEGSNPVAIPGTGTFNYSFIINANTQILVRAIDLG